MQLLEGILPDVHSVHEHLALGSVIKSGYQVYHCRFTAARRADDSHGLALFGGEGDVFKHIVGGVGIAEADVFELYLALCIGVLHALAVLYGGLGVDDLVDTLSGYQRARAHDEDHVEHHERHDDHQRVL